jgi:transglutaminase-like putative cysteine protease
VVEVSGQPARLTGEYVLTLARGDQAPGRADPILFGLEGQFRQETVHTYTIVATPESGESGITITVSHPVSRDTIGAAQQILEIDQAWEPTPDDVLTESDQLGNRWVSATWPSGADDVTSVVKTRSVGRVSYAPILTRSSFPIESSVLPTEVLQWVTVDDWQAQADAPEIEALASDLSDGSVVAIEVVGRVIGWVQENVRMTPCYEPLGAIDALSVLQSRTSNCVGFANLTVALLRATGIPALQVFGVVADNPEPGVAHAWAMAYLPEEGWLEFETSNWMPSWGDVPSTFLLPQHVTMRHGQGRGISSTPFSEQHTCEIRIQEWPHERESLHASINPGQAASWAVVVRSPYFYEVFEHSAGYRDLALDLSLEDIPEDWHADLGATSVVLGNQANGAVPTRSILLTVVSPDDAVAGTSASLDLVAREGNDIVGRLTVRLEVSEE